MMASIREHVVTRRGTLLGIAGTSILVVALAAVINAGARKKSYSLDPPARRVPTSPQAPPDGTALSSATTDVSAARADLRPTAIKSGRAAANPVEETEILATWAEGHFVKLRGRNIGDDVRRLLAIERRTELSQVAETALLDKLAAFLEAFGDTDFEKYARYRDRATLCRSDDPRLSTLTAWVRQIRAQLPGDKSTALPEDPTSLLKTLWDLTYAEGFGPIEPGALIDEIDWEGSGVTVRSLRKADVIAEEWREDAGPESNLYKEFQASGKPRVNMAVCQVAIPNAVGASEIARRDGVLVFADVAFLIRASSDPAYPLLLRFLWDPAGSAWLPLHAAKLWNSSTKPFVW
jgi:hypothetical protein